MFDESDYERASKLAQGEIDAALARHRAQIAARGEGREDCRACGEPIPPARRKAVKAVLCVECQERHEKQGRQRV